ncbi:hypothetical protein [Colwellia sp. E2M01]|uniref:hypothetical protein n=1 Tax=Colwellia sp. E2M01 TaxID=2841561 RepID=UPI001C0980D1|nr:hypothetical protein [Colwellia sp. E2M01]MBU2871978.1 hypothetical protein [Colwellia sp. E2M01]
MQKQIKDIQLEIEAAENTSDFRPAQKVTHLKNALNKAISLMSEMAERIETLEVNTNGQ